MSTQHTEVARWMLEQIKKDGTLYQDQAAYEIASKFGEQFTYMNENGNLAIDRTVLKHFRRLTDETVVWERGYRLWRKREQGDTPGRRQAD
jgi:hypothetical protein